MRHSVRGQLHSILIVVYTICECHQLDGVGVLSRSGSLLFNVLRPEPQHRQEHDGDGDGYRQYEAVVSFFSAVHSLVLFL